MMASSTLENAQELESWSHKAAWIFILVVEAGFVIWGGMAALALSHLMGPGGIPILPAGYQGFTGSSWQQLQSSAPQAAAYMTVLFRVYGAYNVAFGVLGIAITLKAYRQGEHWAWWALLIGNTIALGGAITYDGVVNAIGPFELLEYVGLFGIYAALFVTRPSRQVRP